MAFITLKWKFLAFTTMLILKIFPNSQTYCDIADVSITGSYHITTECSRTATHKTFVFHFTFTKEIERLSYDFKIFSQYFLLFIKSVIG